MSLIDLPIEELEMCGGYAHYEIVAKYGNTHDALLVLQNKLNGRFDAMIVDNKGADQDAGSATPVIRRKPIKKTFIKTLKELVDSGWGTGLNGLETCLVHPTASTVFDLQMLKHCGEERATVGQVCEQNKWHWTSEMLIEKEV